MKKFIYILGAHSRSQTLGFYLCTLNPEINIKAYLVTNDEPNPIEVKGVPVIHIDAESKNLDTSLPVYIGTRSIYHTDLCKMLVEIGFTDVICNTPDYDIKLRNEYLNIYYADKGLPFEKLSGYENGDIQDLDARIYVIRSIFDKPTQEVFENREYEVELQVGAALTQKRICQYSDEVGDNISAKNKQYCELTGLYWMWKNAQTDIVGLEHYRRRFLLPENWITEMGEKKIDVILPTPLYVAPSLEENYRMRHTSEDFDVMMQVIKEKYPDDYHAVAGFLKVPIYSPCNMFIMRKEVLDSYCNWLFPILFEVEKRVGEHEDSYQNRYPGFMAERLMSFYFNYHRSDYHLVYCDKNFIM